MGATHPDGRLRSKIRVEAAQCRTTPSSHDSNGGAEALAIVHQFIVDEWESGSPKTPLARIKVDEKNCFGMIEWCALGNSAGSVLTIHAAVAGWKHRALSFVEHERVKPMPKDRDAEQGDVDGPLECSLALGVVSAKTGPHAAWQQAARAVSWNGVDSHEEWQRVTHRCQSTMAPTLPARWSRTTNRSRWPTARTARKRRPSRLLVP